MACHRSGLAFVLAVVLTTGCGGGGGGGGGGDGGESASTPAETIQPLGWIGSAELGWQRSDAVAKFLWIGGDTGWQTDPTVDPDMPPGRSVRHFHHPWDVCRDADGNLYVADASNHRICKWSASGTSLGWIGAGQEGWRTDVKTDARSETGSLGFRYPRGVVVDGDGNILVADGGNDRICKWSAAGTFLGWLGGGQDGWRTGDAPEPGSDYRSFDSPWAVLVDDGGDILVADRSNHRVCRWTAAGLAIGWIGHGLDGWRTEGDEVFLIGSENLGAQSSFYSPEGISVDGAGAILVADHSNSRVSKWSAAGTSIGWIGHGHVGWQTGPRDTSHSVPSLPWGRGYDHIYGPSDVFVAATGDIYVSSTGLNYVARWSAAGQPLGRLGGGKDGWQKAGLVPRAGPERNSFREPRGLCVDDDGIVYVADDENARISRWSPAGVATGWIGADEDGWQTGSGPHFGEDVRSLAQPSAVCVTALGEILVTTPRLHRVNQWDMDGEVVGFLGGEVDGWQTANAPYEGSDLRSFGWPSDVDTDDDGNIYVLDTWFVSLRKWNRQGTALAWLDFANEKWETEAPASPPDGFLRVRGFARAPDGSLYFAWNRGVAKVGADGKVIGWLGGGQDGWQATEPDIDRSPRGFQVPAGIALDAEGNLYVTDLVLHRVSKWDPNGTAVGWIGGGEDGWKSRAAGYDPEEDEDPEKEDGSGPRRFDSPGDVIVDAEGNIYVADTRNHRISRWNVAGQFEGWIGGTTSGWSRGDAPAPTGEATGFDNPGGLWLTEDGHLFVADTRNNRVTRFRITPPPPPGP